MRIYLLIGQIVKNFYDYSAEYATKIKNTVGFFFLVQKCTFPLTIINT